MPIKTSTVNMSKYEHMKGLPLVQGGRAVELLIGQDNAEAMIPLEVRKGKLADPFAVKTILGWTMNGLVGDVSKRNATTLFVQVESRAQLGDVLGLHNDMSVNDARVNMMQSEDVCKSMNGSDGVALAVTEPVMWVVKVTR